MTAVLWLVGGMLAGWVLARVTSRRRAHAPDSGGLAAPSGELTSQWQRLDAVERHVVSAFLRRKPVAKNLNATFAAQETVGQRVADRVATFGGSWPFIILFGVVITIWMTVNAHTGRPFDPYPFILLNLVLSCLAALQAPVIMMSQNRQAAKDRLDAQHDYEVNLKAEVEILDPRQARRTARAGVAEAGRDAATADCPARGDRPPDRRLRQLFSFQFPVLSSEF